MAFVTNNETFWDNADRTGGPDACWLWLRRRDKWGYGLSRRHGQTLAHRVSYYITHGAIDARKEVHHRCGTKLCVNPAHLELLARSEHARARPRASHCRHGHEYTPENTYLLDGYTRVCRACTRINGARSRARRMALEVAA